MNQTRKYTWAGIAAITMIGLLWAFWPRALPVDFVTVSSGPMSVSITEEGEIRIHDLYVVSTPTSGHLDRVDIEPGDCAIASQSIIASLHSASAPTLDKRTRDQLAANVDSARAALIAAEADITARQSSLSRSNKDLRRIETLARTGTASSQALERQTAEVNELRASLNASLARRDIARGDLRRATAALQPSTSNAAGDKVNISAPVSGVVLQVFRDSEGPVAAGTPLVQIGDPAAIEIVVDLLSEEAVQVQVGDQVTVRGWGGPKLAGTVERIEPFAFTKISALGIEEQRTNVIVRLAQKPSVLGHGYRVKLDIETWSTPDAILAPMPALFKAGREWHTYKIERGRARLTSVQVGHMNGQHAEIMSGLESGDELVTHPSSRIDDGARVSTRNSIRESNEYGNKTAQEEFPDTPLHRASPCGSDGPVIEPAAPN